MRIWKKALSAGLSATMLATIVATSAFAVALPSYTTTAFLTCAAAANTTTCSQVADGISTVTLAGAASTDATHTLYITASGATPIAAAGNFTLAGGTITAPASTALGGGDTITFRSPAAPGTAAVNVYQIDTTTGVAALDGTLTITFTASSGLDVSATKTIVKTLDSCALNLAGDAFTGTKIASAPATPANAAVAHLCVLVLDGNGNPVNNAKVSATITPVGILVGSVTGQTTDLTTGLNGVADFTVKSSGLSGTSAIATSATVNSKTTSFAPISFTFTGAIAKITLTTSPSVFQLNSDFSCFPWDGSDACPLQFTAFDAAGSKVATSDATYIVSRTDLTTTPENGKLVDFYDGDQASFSGTGKYIPGDGDVVCKDVAGTETVAVKAGGVTSNAVTITCSDVATKFSVAFDKTTVAPGATATLVVTALDDNGLPAADNQEEDNGITVMPLVSAGAITPLSAHFVDGKASFTYLAPFNTGIASALVSVSTISGTQTASINIGAVVPVASGTNASALGITKVGPFTTTTKAAALGKYQTFRMKLGTSAAGKTVAILVAKKNSAGVWSAFTRLTSRVADSSGTVYFSWRSSSVSWISVRGSLDTMLTNAVQARWR